MFFVYFKEIQSLDFFHRLHTTNSHKTPSLNSVLEKKVLTETVFIIRRKSFSPLAQYHH